MNRESEFHHLDLLLAEEFAPAAAQAPPGFTARVMAAVAESGRSSLWEALLAAAKPLLVTGWAAAGLLAFLAVKAVDSGHDAVMVALMSADTAARWLAL